MHMVAFPQRIASTFVVVCGVYGDVTRQAHERGVSRQTLYREAAATQTCLDGSAQRQHVADLLDQVRLLQQDVARLQGELARSVVLTTALQAQFAAVGEANGVSLPTARILLKVLQPDQALSVSHLGRLVQQAGQRAGAVLAVLDEHSRALVQQAAADEIYVPAPVLMVVESESLCWLTGQLTTQVNGEVWAKQFSLFPALEQTTRDAGNALGSGVARVNAQRQAQGLPPLADQFDHFHTLREGQRAQRQVEACWQRAFAQAEQQEQEHDRQRRRGAVVSGGAAAKASRLWRQAEQALDRAEASARAWERTQAALRLFTPAGELNTRAQAEAVLAETLPHLPEPEFAKTKRLLRDPRTLTYLDEVQRKLTALPLPAELWRAAVRVEGLRRHPELGQGESPQAAAVRGVLVVCAVLLSQAGAVGQQAQEAVRKILRTTWRASSLVEGINSVLRMHQRRHRKITPGMLNLKRLYWNCHRFRTGPRRDQTPYELLGVKLPEKLDWWDLLKIPPEQLRDKLSALNKVK